MFLFFRILRFLLCPYPSISEGNDFEQASERVIVETAIGTAVNDGDDYDDDSDGVECLMVVAWRVTELVTQGFWRWGWRWLELEVYYVEGTDGFCFLHLHS